MMKQPRVRIVMPHGDGQFLLETLSNPKYPERLGKTRFPGGGVDEGETPRQAAIRELREELGLEVGEDKLEEMGVLPHPEWGHDEHYYWLKEHGLNPGVFKPTVTGVGDPEVHLAAGKPEGEKFFGADIAPLLAKRAALAAPAPQPSQPIPQPAQQPQQVRFTATMPAEQPQAPPQPQGNVMGMVNSMRGMSPQQFAQFASGPGRPLMQAAGPAMGLPGLAMMMHYFTTQPGETDYNQVFKRPQPVQPPAAPLA